MRPTVLSMLAALLLFLCIACNNAARHRNVISEETKTEDAALDKGVATADTAAIATDKEFYQASPGQAPAAKNNKQAAPAPIANPDWDKKIVKTADLDVEVKNFLVFTDRLRQNVRQAGGYIAQERQTQSLATIENTVMVKVPVDRFEDLLLKMASDSDRLVEKRINSEDVTAEWVDTRTRLETKKEVRERYLELLKQARSMKDILAVQEEINNLQEEMDAAAGRIAYLGHSAAYSTINLKFYQVLDATVKDNPSPSFWHKLKGSIGEGWDWLGSLVLGLITIWPLLLLGGLGWMVARRRLQIVRRKTGPVNSLLLIGIAAGMLLLSSSCNERIGKGRPAETVKFTPPRAVKDEEVKQAEDKGTAVQDEALVAPPPPVRDDNDMARSGFNREGYAHIAENRFLAAQQEPLSTFSIDVDAASYSNVRRFIQQGALPPAGAVRIEEMINYFDYRYPQPAAGDPFSVNTELSACPWNSAHRLVLIGLQGKASPVEQLPAANLVFLIDVSGSMNEPNKLPLVKTSLKMLTEQLRDDDRVAIVVYAGNAGLVLPSTAGSEKHKIKQAIDNLEAGGSTAGGEGLALAYSVAQKNFIKGGNNRIILATDGDFNVGPSSDDELVGLIEKQRQTGVFLSVLGFGVDNYQDDKMQQLADKGNGNHSYIDNSNEARKVLVKEFASSLFTIAKDVKIQVEFNPAKVQAYRLIGYENRALAAEDFNDDRKDAGELGSGHRVTALYEIIPTGVKDEFTTAVDPLKYQTKRDVTASAEKEEWMTVKLRYKQPEGEESRLISRTVVGEAVSLETASANFRFASAVAEFGLLLRNSEFKEESSWQQVVSLAKGAKESDGDGYRSEFIGLVETAGALAVAKR